MWGPVQNLRIELCAWALTALAGCHHHVQSLVLPPHAVTLVPQHLHYQTTRNLAQ